MIQNLEEEVQKKHLEIEELSEKNMETVVALKKEISQMKKKMKDSKGSDVKQSTR